RLLDRLAEENIHVDVLDMRTIRPLDIDSVIESVKKTNRLLVVDQSWPFAGISSEVITQIIEHAFDHLDHQPVRLNTEDVPTPYAKNLEADYLPNADRIVEAVKANVAN
ncbi:MAG: transketolase C-terminal domain-containing protein, partial [Planctomycetota bacterium]